MLTCKNKVSEIKEAIISLGHKPPSGLIKEDLLAFYQGILEMNKRKISPTIINKDIKLEFIPVVADKDLPWKEHFMEHGWAVVKLENFPLEEIRTEFFSWLHKICPRFLPNDPETWLKKNMPYNSRGIFKHGIGHTEFCWKTREACLPVFEEFWDTRDLLTSFDGGCFLTSELDKDQKNWMFHQPVNEIFILFASANKIKTYCDQPRKIRDFASLQGVVNLFPNGEKDGGTLLMHDSHHKFIEYLETHPMDGISAFFPIDPFAECLKDCPIIKPCLEEGEMLLFDSRVFHCNISPESSNPRMCIYVSMMPRKGATEKELQKRISLAENARMTGHWCYGPAFSVCPEKPHYLYSKGYPEIKEIEKAEMTPLRKRLIGY